jgi:hypothetical protein
LSYLIWMRLEEAKQFPDKGKENNNLPLNEPPA